MLFKLFIALSISISTSFRILDRIWIRFLSLDRNLYRYPYIVQIATFLLFAFRQDLPLKCFRDELMYFCSLLFCGNLIARFNDQSSLRILRFLCFHYEIDCLGGILLTEELLQPIHNMRLNRRYPLSIQGFIVSLIFDTLHKC